MDVIIKQFINYLFDFGLVGVKTIKTIMSSYEMNKNVILHSKNLSQDEKLKLIVLEYLKRILKNGNDKVSQSPIKKNNTVSSPRKKDEPNLLDSLCEDIVDKYVENTRIEKLKKVKVLFNIYNNKTKIQMKNVLRILKDKLLVVKRPYSKYGARASSIVRNSVVISNEKRDSKLNTSNSNSFKTNGNGNGNVSGSINNDMNNRRATTKIVKKEIPPFNNSNSSLSFKSGISSAMISNPTINPPLNNSSFKIEKNEKNENIENNINNNPIIMPNTTSSHSKIKTDLYTRLHNEHKHLQNKKESIREYKDKQEISKYTFTPNLRKKSYDSRNSKLIENLRESSPSNNMEIIGDFLHRQSIFDQKQKENIEEFQKKEIEKYQENCTFRPQLNDLSNSKILKKKNSISSIYDEDASPRFEKLFKEGTKRQRNRSLDNSYNTNNENLNRTVNFNKINNLYIDHKNKKVRNKERLENLDKEKGITFKPKLYSNRNYKINSTFQERNIPNYKSNNLSKNNIKSNHLFKGKDEIQSVRSIMYNLHYEMGNDDMIRKSKSRENLIENKNNEIIINENNNLIDLEQLEDQNIEIKEIESDQLNGINNEN